MPDTYLASISLRNVPLATSVGRIMPFAIQVAESVLMLIAFVFALMISYRAIKGYSITRNANLALIGTGFILIALYLLISSISFLHLLPRPYPFERHFLYNAILEGLQFIAYFLIMIAYLVPPRAEVSATILSLFLLTFLGFDFATVAVLAVTAISVYVWYRENETASTALVLASFALLFLIHLLDLFLAVVPHLFIITLLYTTVFEVFSFALLFMAMESYPSRNKPRGKQSVA
ncbi:MAG: hypothetical protein QXP70_01255 [Methanomassiliicoccales archaeon]